MITNVRIKFYYLVSVALIYLILAHRFSAIRLPIFDSVTVNLTANLSCVFRNHTNSNLYKIIQLDASRFQVKFCRWSDDIDIHDPVVRYENSLRHQANIHEMVGFLLELAPRSWNLGISSNLAFKKLIYHCPKTATCGGIGDRINGMLSVFSLALLTDSLFILDDWLNRDNSEVHFADMQSIMPRIKPDHRKNRLSALEIISRIRKSLGPKKQHWRNQIQSFFRIGRIKFGCNSIFMERLFLKNWRQYLKEELDPLFRDYSVNLVFLDAVPSFMTSANEILSRLFDLDNDCSKKPAIKNRILMNMNILDEIKGISSNIVGAYDQVVQTQLAKYPSLNTSRPKIAQMFDGIHRISGISRIKKTKNLDLIDNFQSQYLDKILLHQNIPSWEIASIGIQVRTGGSGKKFEDPSRLPINRQTSSIFSEQALHICTRSRSRICSYFITTDSQEMYDWIEIDLKIGLIGTNVSFDITKSPGEPSHIDRSQFISFNDFFYLKSYLDWRVLSCLDYLIISRSGFGETATWFRNRTTFPMRFVNDKFQMYSG